MKDSETARGRRAPEDREDRMECTDLTIKELLPQYGKASLDPAESRRVEEHLAACGDCRDELALLRMAASEPVPDPGEAFWAGLPDRVRREVHRHPAPEPGPVGQALARVRAIFSLRPVWISASLAAVLLAVSLAVLGPPKKEEPAAVPAAGDETVYDDRAGPDAAFSTPLPDLSELTPEELDTADSWAGKELSAMVLEAETVQGAASESDLDEAVSELNPSELKRLSSMLDTLKKEGRS